MIGVDLTRITRFEKIDLTRLGKKLGHTLDSPRTAAKIWACLEAITKAEGRKINARNIQILFPRGCAPTVTNKDFPVAYNPNGELTGDYTLSLSHEGDYVIVVALKKEK
jgi:phosphopantetheinyl transferase (holo-ACP synthase)